MKPGPSIRRLLIGVNVLTFLVPIGAVALLRLYHTHLAHMTEQALISESVVIGEAWRERWLEEQGLPAEPAPAIRPPGTADDGFFPVEPSLSLQGGLLPPAPPASRVERNRDGPEWRAGARIHSILSRARLSNLSGARVLNRKGCTLATTADDVGACFDETPEVQQALAGHYTSVARERLSDERYPMNSISRGGDIRVFTALPIFSDGQVVAVVRMSRTSLAPLKALWLDRRVILVGLAGSLLLTLLVSFYSARTISRPVREITRVAQAIARGESRQPLAPTGTVPAEVYALSSALDTMTAQLSDRAAYISEFAANVSHELKTPLTSIRGAAELVRDQWTEMSEAERHRFLDNIQGDVERMERLVTRLLHLARIQSAPGRAERVPLRPFFEALTARHGAQVRLDLTQAPEAMVIHADHLESAVRNLVDNAVRHGEGKPVEVAVRDQNGRTVIVVRDHGPGISEGNQRHLFERFFTTERDRGGTGLGLNIVQAVAKTRGGSVSFETGGSGTVFTLTL